MCTPVFNSLCNLSRSGVVEPYGNCIFVSENRLHPFQFPQVMIKVSDVSVLLQTFVIFKFLDYNHFRVCDGVIALWL